MSDHPASARLPIRRRCLNCDGQTYRIVYQTVYDERQVTAYRVEYETVYEEQKVTSYRPEWETRTQERRLPRRQAGPGDVDAQGALHGRKPVWETVMRDASYTRTRYVEETASGRSAWWSTSRSGKRPNARSARP